MYFLSFTECTFTNMITTTLVDFR